MLIVHLAFLLTGVVTTMLGPMLPFLIPHWHLTDAQAGQLFIAQFVGGFFGSLLASKLMGKFGSRYSMAMGLFLAALGVAALWSPVHGIGMLALFAYGSGMGITAPATNMLVAQTVPGNSAGALNLLNFSWTAGAVIGSPAVSLIVPRTQPSYVTYALAIALMLAAVAVALRTRTSAAGGTIPTNVTRKAGSWSSIPLIVLLTIPMFFLYVGVENGVAGWLPLFCTRLFGQHSPVVAIAQACFWGSLLAGRLFAPLVLRRVSPERVISSALVIAMGGTVLLLASASPYMLVPGVVLTGLGFAVVLPTAVAQVTRFDRLAADRFAGLLFAFAGLGGAALPSLVGLISSRTGSLRTGLTVAAAAVAIMLVLNLRISRLFVPMRARTSVASI